MPNLMERKSTRRVENGAAQTTSVREYHNRLLLLFNALAFLSSFALDSLAVKVGCR
jgi:hypothetical protein